MSFEDKLSGIMAGEILVGKEVDSLDGEKLDFGVNIRGNQYEMFLVEGNYALARNGIVEYCCSDDRVIDNLLSLVRRDWAKMRGDKNED